MGADLLDYVWGKTNERVEIPIANERECQTYFGALDIVERKMVFQAQEKGNTECMIKYLKYLMKYFKRQRLLLIWGGASYHRSKEIKELLTEVNEGYAKKQWRIHCVRLSPNQPRQNPIEDV
ncbi:transposase [Synechocystis salina LEGE 06155]|nr:transposase [Synechocystis salina LEGE 06155]